LLYGAWCQWLAAQVEHLDGRASAGDERLARAIEFAQRAGAGNGLSLMHYQRTAADWAREHGDLEAAAKATAGVAAAARSRNGHDDPDLFVELAQLHAQMGRPEQSLAWRQQAQALYDTRLDPGNAKQRANASALAALYQRSGQPEAAARLRQRYGL
jgi:tetratricopeptide (TPR) repeat protein